MTYTRFLDLVRSAAESKDEEMFIGEVGYPADISLDSDGFLKAMHIVYIAANGKFKELVEGHTLARLSRNFNIPYRTLQRWCAEERESPIYVKHLIAFALISELEGKDNGDI